ncbi:MAG: glycosyltransferase family 2 protein, partial [Bacteroidota bacterium]
PCWMTYKKDFEAIGAFNSNIYPEDYDLAFRFYQGGLECIPSNEILHLWRDHPERASRNDEHYQDNQFLELKLTFFLEIERDQSRPLVLWGAGKRGKKLAKLLIEREIDFFWVSNNSNKIGKNIYGRVIQDVFYSEALEKPQLIIQVSSPFDQSAIRAYLNAQLLEAIEDYFFFC